MRRFFGSTMILTAVLAVGNHPAQAQYGWGGWGVGGPASGVGVLPGAGAGRPGMGAGGVGGPASGVGVLPGAGAGRPGVPGAYGDAGRYGYGTHYAGDSALYVQRNSFIGTGAAYPAYGAGMYAASPGAWAPTNMTGGSVYANPGYGAVAGQLEMAQQPAPYDYGGNVVAQPNGVYVNGDNVGTPQQYASQASGIAASGNAQPDPNTQWQPLGVFAMVEPGQTSSDDIFQLAVSPQGTLRGNYHDVKDNTVTPLAGAVDPKTQRAAWTIGGDQAPVYEAGIANLTREQTTMLLHTPDGQQRQFTLIRLQDPSQAAGAASAPAPARP
jgi:hypothetical protein